MESPKKLGSLKKLESQKKNGVAKKKWGRYIKCWGRRPGTSRTHCETSRDVSLIFWGCETSQKRFFGFKTFLDIFTMNLAVKIFRIFFTMNLAVIRIFFAMNFGLEKFFEFFDNEFSCKNFLNFFILTYQLLFFCRQK